MENKKVYLKEGYKFLIKISISFLQAFVVFVIGFLVSFAIFKLSFEIPHLNRLSMLIDPGDLNLILIQIGYYDPLPVQFLKYSSNFFTGNWGNSYITFPGLPVTEVVRRGISTTFEIMVLPLLIGLGGFKLGRIWTRKKEKVSGKILTPIVAIGVALPLFVLSTILQYLFATFTELEVFGRYSISFYSSLPDITGLLLFDSIISGNWPLVFDIILHSILPWFILSLVIITLVLKQARARIESDPRKNSIPSNSLIAGKLFGYLFLFMVIIELTFNLRGFGFSFIQSFYQGNPLVINGCILVIVILFSFTLLFANLIPITMEFVKRSLNKGEVHFEAAELKEKYREEASKKLNFKHEFKSYVKSSLKNPYTIIGGCLILLLVIAAIIYPLLGFYSLEEIIMPIIPLDPPYSPPSPAHPLGTTRFGYDVLARILYGMQGTIMFGVIVVLIGLGGGSLFGFLAGKFHKYIYNGVIGTIILFFLFPSFYILMIGTVLLGFNYQSIIVLAGILLIPIFARIIANAIRREKNFFEIAKSIIKSIPLEVTFTILLFQALGFMGFSDPSFPQLGETFNWGTSHLSAIWASFWPGLFIFLITLGLIFLHEGLQAPASHKTRMK